MQKAEQGLHCASNAKVSRRDLGHGVSWNMKKMASHSTWIKLHPILTQSCPYMPWQVPSSWKLTSNMA